MKRYIFFILSIFFVDILYIFVGFFPPLYSYEEKYVMSGRDFIRPLNSSSHAAPGQIRARKICVYWRGVSLEKEATGVREECEAIRR